MNKIPILLKKEFWQHQGMFFYLPLVITLFVILMLVLSLTVMRITVTSDDDARIRMRSSNGDFEWQIEEGDRRSVHDIYVGKLKELSGRPMQEREQALSTLLLGLSAPIRATLWFVVLFYLMGALYEDRKDRSILFWKSLPVSDLQTVLIKLAAALVMAPIIAFVFIVITELITLMVATLIAMFEDVSAWETLWVPANLIEHWLSLIGMFAFTAVWSLPVYGWALFASAFAKSVPFLWAVGIPFGISFIETVAWRGEFIREWIMRHLLQPFAYAFSGDFRRMDVTDLLASWDILSGLVVGFVFVAAAIWMRGQRDEI